MLSDQLVWVGARNGRSYTQDPLPISVAGASRTFRKAATDALALVKRDWRLVCEDRNMLVFYAMLEADLTVAPMLTSTVPNSLQLLEKDCGLPNSLQLLEKDCGLPSLPTFNINIYAPKASIDELTSELARYVKEQFVTRYRRVA